MSISSDFLFRQAVVVFDYAVVCFLYSVIL